MQPDTRLTAMEAASVLHDTRLARETLNNRAAGMAWISWALVLTSLAGTLGFLDRIPHENLDGRGWALFLFANLLAIVAWAGLGGLLQTAIYRAFSVERPTGHSAWKGAAIAFGVALAVIIVTFGLGNGRALWAIGPEATLEEQHHNLGFAIPLQIGAAFLAAVTVLQGYRGYSRRPGLIAAGACIVASFLAVAPWVPDLGTAGALLAVAALPAVFIGIGFAYWRQG